MQKLSRILSTFMLAMSLAVTCYGAKANSAPDYSQADNWVYLEKDSQKPTDVFLLAPVVVTGKESLNIDLNNPKVRGSFVAALEMQKGIYNQQSRMFAPFYRQVSLPCFYGDNKEKYFKVAYKDVKKSFKYYLKHYNQGRPLVVAGFSHGSQNAIKLLKDYLPKKSFQKQYISSFAVGWRLTEDDVKEQPLLKPAQGESDTGVVVAFNTEAPEIDDTIMIPKGVKTHAINPINWRTDGTLADKSLGKGACFVNGKGKIIKEIPHFTSAYIDDKRGALKLPELNPKDYPAVIFQDGVYHIYDYQFFYRDLQDNVAKRIASYMEKQ